MTVRRRGNRRPSRPTAPRSSLRPVRSHPFALDSAITGTPRGQSRRRRPAGAGRRPGNSTNRAGRRDQPASPLPGHRAHLHRRTRPAPARSTWLGSPCWACGGRRPVGRCPEPTGLRPLERPMPVASDRPWRGGSPGLAGVAVQGPAGERCGLLSISGPQSPPEIRPRVGRDPRRSPSPIPCAVAGVAQLIGTSEVGSCAATW
jgi:hypothetical protein